MLLVRISPSLILLNCMGLDVVKSDWQISQGRLCDQGR